MLEHYHKTCSNIYTIHTIYLPLYRTRCYSHPPRISSHLILSHLISPPPSPSIFPLPLSQVYMLELYQDNLQDLLLPKGAAKRKLDIKKDSKVRRAHGVQGLATPL